MLYALCYKWTLYDHIYTIIMAVKGKQKFLGSGLVYFRWRQPSVFVKTRKPKSNDKVVMKSHCAIYCLWFRRTKRCVSNCLRGLSDTIMIHLSPSKSHIGCLTECIKHLDHIEASFHSQQFKAIAKQTHAECRLISIFLWLCTLMCFCSALIKYDS